MNAGADTCDVHKALQVGRSERRPHNRISSFRIAYQLCNLQGKAGVLCIRPCKYAADVFVLHIASGAKPESSTPSLRF